MIRSRVTLVAVVHQGSALEGASYAKALNSLGGGGRATVLVSDPPYCRLVRRRRLGDEREHSLHKRERKLDVDGTTMRFENIKAYSSFTDEWLAAALTYGLEPRSDLIIWSNLQGRSLIIDAAERQKYSLMGEFKWAKFTTTAKSANLVNANEKLLRLHETALIFRHNQRPDLPRPSQERDWRLPTAVISEASEHEHPCHKPLQVVLPLIQSYTAMGDVVLDCFAGSGGIVAAAVASGRRAVGLELDPVWASKAAEAVARG